MNLEPEKFRSYNHHLNHFSKLVLYAVLFMKQNALLNSSMYANNYVF